MADPFESLQQPGTVPHSALRESFIQQAVTFLNDPRVRGADPNAALDFLRKKGITEDELREAYRRSGVPFPSQLASSFPAQANTPLAAQYFHTTAQLTPFQQAGPARGASWLSVFFGITAAAGIYAALREVLKRYVVPLYFPEAARVAEERRRRDEVSWQVQETQIGKCVMGRSCCNCDILFLFFYLFFVVITLHRGGFRGSRGANGGLKCVLMCVFEFSGTERAGTRAGGKLA